MATPKLTPDQIAQVSDLVSGYILTQREKYAPRAAQLSVRQRASLEPFFAREVIDTTRVLAYVSQHPEEFGTLPKPDDA